MLSWPERLEDGLFQKSRTMAAPWGPLLRLLRYPAALTRDWLAGEINIRAMSLAYTTLLSLVPLMVFSFSILKALGAHGDLRYLLHQFFRPLGAATNQLTEGVLQFVTNMRGDVLGSLGLAFLVYTVITTVQKVENSFNFVWRVERPRGFARRVAEYLSVTIIGPLVLALAIGMLGSAQDSPLTRWLDAIPALASALALLNDLVPYVLVTVVFTLMYAFIPNTQVQRRPALIGGVAAGIVWALVGQLFTAFLLYSSKMLAVYTGFAIVLTTLVWVYLSWLILLLGAQLAFYVQFPQYLRQGHESIELTGSARERAGLSVMVLIASDYGSGKIHWTSAALAAELDIPRTALAPVLASLERGRLLVATAKEQYLPARDMGNIRLIDIVDAVRTRHSGRLPIDVRALPAAARVMADVEAAIDGRLGARSLRELIGAP